MAEEHTSGDRSGEAPRPPSILVPPAWLQEGLEHPRLRVIDLRDRESYDESHVRGAVRLDLAELGSSDGGCDNVILPTRDFTLLMERLGVSTGDAVVAYDDQWGLAAARLIWALHYYGHTSASVLDGGWDRWLEEGRPTSAETRRPDTGSFEAVADPAVHADLGWMVRAVEGGDAALIDTRSASEFEQGHVPGARSWDWLTAVPPGSWASSREPEELLREWAALDVEPSREVVVYCRSGMRAAHTWVVLRHAGFERVRLYDGSWQEWSRSVAATEEG